MIVLFLLHSLLAGKLSFSQLCRRVFLVVILKLEAHSYLKDESEEVIRIQTRLHRMIETNRKIECLSQVQHLMKSCFYDWQWDARQA
jgi:hypothetical protein